MFAYVRPWIWLRYRCSASDRNVNSFTFDSPSGRDFCDSSNVRFRMTSSSIDHRTRFDAATVRAYRSMGSLSIVACMAHLLLLVSVGPTVRFSSVHRCATSIQAAGSPTRLASGPPSASVRYVAGDLFTGGRFPHAV